MQRITVRSKRQRLVLQLAALAGIGFGGAAIADDHGSYADYYGTGKVEQVAAQDCPPIPCCPPGTIMGPSNPGMMTTVPSDLPMGIEAGDAYSTPGTTGSGANNLGSDAGFGDSFSQAPIPQSQVNNFSNTGNSLALASSNSGSGNLDAPNMMGDFFGGNYTYFGFPGGGGIPGDPVFPYGNAAIAGGDRRFKISENTSPIPQDRVFFNYNHFHNAVRTINERETSVDRMLFGFEKTFFDSMTSIEFRLPFAAALNSTQTFQGGGNEAVEFGNIAFALKASLLTGPDWLLSTGVTLTLPTGDDSVGRNTDGTRRYTVENDSVQLAPFVGFVKQFGRRSFFQSFIQANFDLNGYEITDGAGAAAGVLQDQHLLFLDASLGRWLYRVDNACGLQQGVAAVTELHYTTTMNDADSVTFATGEGFANPANRIDVLNMTTALHFQYGSKTLRLGAVAPLKDEFDRTFDTELFLQMNCFF